MDDKLKLVVTTEPQSASDIYRKLRGIPVNARLSSAQKNERRRIAHRLEQLAEAGAIRRTTREMTSTTGSFELAEFSLV